MWITIILLVTAAKEGSPAVKDLSINAEFDFEDAKVPSDVTGTGDLAISGQRYKHGTQSLRWTWKEQSTGQTLRWKNLNIPGNNAVSGGVVLHVYNSQPMPKCLHICVLIESSTKPDTVCKSCFYASLGFKGWRTVWAAYEEFRGCPTPLPLPCQYTSNTIMTQFSIQAPKQTHGTIYVDYVRFIKKLKKGTRDFVIPAIKKADGSGCFECEEFDHVTEKDLVYHTPQYLKWEHALRWWIHAAHSATNSKPLSGNTLNYKITQVARIKKRMLTWYADEDMDYFILSETAPKTRLTKRYLAFLQGYEDARTCWKNSGNIVCSHVLFNDMSINPNTLVGPGLFCRDLNPYPVNREMKFREVFSKVILPMAIDLRMWSKVFSEEFAIGAHTSSDESSDCPEATTAKAYNGFKRAIEKVNEIRLERLILLLKYVREQGFEEGSGLGSLDHQMLYGHGIVHAVLVMSDAITTANDPDLTLHQLIRMLKWYLDFGQMDQEQFENKGATCDQVRFHMLFRLVTILAMPEDTDAEKNEKIDDLKKLVKWIHIVFTPNEGLFGFLTPDHLVFHHSFYYAGAYCADALHVAALVCHMLSGAYKDLSCSPETRGNLTKALQFERNVSPLHSIPPSCNGRYPSYTAKWLAKTHSAFAYMAFDPHKYNAQKDPVVRDLLFAKMFARLNAPESTLCPDKFNLCSGKISGLTFMNSLGESQFLEKVNRILKHAEIPPESSPRGNWAKNYAALSVHRRGQCVVTAKGFNRYVYSPERYSGENEYGLFEMNGAVQIANSEEALKTKNVEEGWLWNKIPGTTALDLTNLQLRQVGGNRYSNQEKLAGAVSIIGLARDRTKANGVFGMNYAMPKYWYKVTPHPLHDKTFEFKKSVFFFDNTMVCLGSGISSTVERSALTTLFQDSVILQGSHPSGTAFYCDKGEAITKENFHGNVRLIDVHGNIYHVLDGTSKDLVFERGVIQHSVKSKGVDVPSQGKYCTAWLDHGLMPLGAKYEYIVQTNCTTVQHPSIEKYKILRNSEKAHVVSAQIGTSLKQYGYVLFIANANLPSAGPISRVDTDCLVMVEETPDALAISVSYPQMNLGVGPIPQSAKDVNPDFCKEKIPEDPESANYPKAKVTSLFFCAEDKGKDIVLELRDKDRKYNVEYVFIGGDKVQAERRDEVAHFENGVLKIFGLKNGKPSEVHLKL